MQSTREWLLRCLRLRLHRLEYRQTVRERVLRCLRLRLHRLQSGQATADDLYARGEARERGRGVAKNTLKAVDHYADAAELGHEEARRKLERLADRGRRPTYAAMRACVRLARLHARGRGGVARDFRKAAELCEQAAEHASCLQKVGELSRRMLRLRALVFRRRLAKAGDPHALRVLGESYMNDRDMRPNYRKALDWHVMLAKQGDAHALLRAGEASEIVGWYDTALACFSALTQNGSSEIADRACAGMGRLREYGRGVKQSDEEALKWHRMRKRDPASVAELFWRGGLFDPARKKNRAALLRGCRMELHNLLAPERARLLNALRQAAGRPPAPSFQAHVAAAALPRRYADGLDMLERILKMIPQNGLNGWAELPWRFGPDAPVKGELGGWRNLVVLANRLSKRVADLGPWPVFSPRVLREFQQEPPKPIGANDILENAPPLLQGLELLRLARLERTLGKHDDALKTEQAARKPLRIALAAMVGYAEARERWREDAAQGLPYAAKRLARPLESLWAMNGARQGEEANLDFDMMAALARRLADSHGWKTRFNI